jgi:type I restriction enzyme R subunit
MTAETEYTLEEKLIDTLVSIKYERVNLKSEEELLSNLKKQLEKQNNTTFSDNEFKRIRNHLSSGNVFACSTKLREKYTLERDDKTISYIEFFDTKAWCKNQYQVTNQVTIEGKYTNRYDVTLLVNGLPLVQIELKRRGMEMKEAFNQIKRYDKHSYSEGWGLFKYVQLFVISNGENTKYFANDAKLDFSFTNFWADDKNQKINQLMDFAKIFLEPCHVSKMIAKYMVLNSQNKLMVLRPYQFYAAERIEELVKNSDKNGFIWHTTGSGKTLTSFKASQLIKVMPEVDKVVFVVDRNDLDIQTQREFDFYMKGCVDRNTNTNSLVKKLKSNLGEDKLVLTTIQKLDKAMKGRFASHIEHLQDKNVVFIFDECHRSQFGKTHKLINEFFNNNQMIGFTGTPIFKENSPNKALGHTTENLFGKILHKYLVNDAIADNNVIPFSVDYYKTLRDEHLTKEEKKQIDYEAEYSRPKRISEITKNIIDFHNKKTKNREFTAILATSSISNLLQYYNEFKKLKEEGTHKLKIATIFSYQANEDENANSDIDTGMFEDMEEYSPHSRELLDKAIEDYNSMFGTKYSTSSFKEYNDDVSNRVRAKEIDILIVVNMYLTGYDSKALNTLYVDKNLKYHGLIQAFSRTNRILNSQKSHGNIICYRYIKDEVDQAVKMFSNPDSEFDNIIMKEFEEYVKEFKVKLESVKEIAQKPDDIPNFQSEEKKAAFILAFRSLLRTMNILDTFSEFTFDKIGWTEEEFNAYKSQYLDLKDSIGGEEGGETSSLSNLDFELELLRTDIINVDYIIALLSGVKSHSISERDKLIKTLEGKIDSQESLRYKKDLIMEFVNRVFENKESLDKDKLKDSYDEFLEDKEDKEVKSLAQNLEISVIDLVDIRDSRSFKGYFENDKIKDIISKDQSLGFLEKRNKVKDIKNKLIELAKRFN